MNRIVIFFAKAKNKLFIYLKKFISFLLNPLFVLCFLLAWLITNGWSYILFTLGAALQINWMVIFGGAYLGFLWAPVSPEKIVTLIIAIFLLKLIFPNDEKTLKVLENQLKKLKQYLKSRRKNKRKVKNMISVRSFGKTKEGIEAQLFILDNGNMSVYITDFGAHIVAINVPDKDGIITDIVLGADNVDAYAGNIDYMGATIGRFANRIEKGKFILNDKEYTLAVNNGPNHLHGGVDGFNHKLFDAFVDGETLKLSYNSPDGEEGYPGNLSFSVSFTLKDDNTLDIEYNAVSDADTVVNFTNHAYFNLNGALSEKNINNHYLFVNADAFCGCDNDCLADGTILPVRNTAMDFRQPTILGERLNSDFDQIKKIGGIDHNFVLDMKSGNYKKAAELYCADNSVKLECFTDQPGIQIYTSNSTDYHGGKCGTYYGKHSAICLETQTFPNATSFSYFPSPVLKKNEKFYSKTSYKFTVVK